MKLLKNQKGIALMLVLSAITLLTTMIVEFAYNTNVNYNLALNERDRLKAYYLAKSAYSFMLLELKFDQMFRQIVQRQNLGQYLGANAQLPLCQQFPLSTGLIRTVFTGGLEGLMGGGDEEDEVDEEMEKMQKDVSLSQEKSAQEFLQFEGDFDGECVSESTKMNLNAFSGLGRTSTVEGVPSPLEQYKQFFYAFLSKPEYELLFEAADVRETDAIDNISDWVDPDVDMDQFGGKRGGAERSMYDKLGAQYPIRNGKLITLLEAYLINDVKDQWFAPLMDQFTIYGDGKINVCTSSNEIVESLIKRYIAATPGLPPIRLDDPEEMGRLVSSIMDTCAAGGTGDQLAQQIASALNQAITGGGAEEGAETPAPTTPQPGQAGTGGFASYISSENRYYTLNLAGQVMDTTVRIRAVIDVKEKDPKRWKLLYWRVY